MVYNQKTYQKVIKTTIHDFQTHLYLHFSFLQYFSFLVIPKSQNNFPVQYQQICIFIFMVRSVFFASTKSCKILFHLCRYFKCLGYKSYRLIYEFQNLI